MLPRTPLLRHLVRPWLGRAWPLLLVLVPLGAVLGHEDAGASQLNLNWVDTSGGQAGFMIERQTGTTGIYVQIGQQPPGIPSYVDSTVAPGTTYCYRVRAYDADGVSDYSNEACGSVSGLNLTVSKTGTGSGSVASNPAGIDCGTACSASYAAGALVTLTATPASGSIFGGWSGGGCAGTDPCIITGNGSVAVSAAFATAPPTSYTLTVSKSGPGTVTSSPGGISCGSICSAAYASGTVSTLTAVPRRGASFTGWSGAGCSGTGTCTVTLDANVAVSAIFSKGAKK